MKTNIIVAIFVLLGMFIAGPAEQGVIRYANQSG